MRPTFRVFFAAKISAGGLFKFLGRLFRKFLDDYDNDVYAERPSRAQVAYLDNVVAGVANREEELDAEIQKLSIGWDISRISKLTRSIMQLALYEIQYVEDVPTGVAIAEAVRIAKKYDTDETGSFVNGILGTFARSLTKAEETVKTEETE